MEAILMLEFIKNRRIDTLSECRELLIRINGSQQLEKREILSADRACFQSPEDSEQIYMICDCCKEPDIPKESMTLIESGHLLCPTCIEAFLEASASKQPG